MNTETITLAMNRNDADKIAFVLMAALHTTSMLGSERIAATDAANALFDQLGYGLRTTLHGERIEKPPAHRRLVKGQALMTISPFQSVGDAAEKLRAVIPGLDQMMAISVLCTVERFPSKPWVTDDGYSVAWTEAGWKVTTP